MGVVFISCNFILIIHWLEDLMMVQVANSTTTLPFRGKILGNFLDQKKYSSLWQNYYEPNVWCTWHN